MKYLSILFSFITVSVAVAAQNYNDSGLTFQTTQQGADYIGRYLSATIIGNKIWANTSTPGQLKPFLGSGTNNDSVFTVTTKAEFLIGMLQQLLSNESFITATAFNKIVNNSPAIPLYTGLATQIVNKKNGNSSEKLVAQYVYDWYIERTKALTAKDAAEKTGTRTWSNY